MFRRLTLVLLAVYAITLTAELQAAESEMPNIVFIFADDWGWGDLSCHGHPYVKTPNIDRLAREGTDFHRFTVASGVCSPSRTAVMTGHFPARYNIDGHFAWVPSNAKRNMPDWLSPQAPLLPRFLKQAGYSTAHFGKWHLANNMIPDSPLPSEYGYDEYGAFNCAGEQMPVHEDSEHAVAFIEKCQKQNKPFFVNLWIHEPHTPFHTQPKYRWRFRDLDEPDNIYASVLSHADDRIGEVLDTLDRLELTEKTLVIFSSDNGPARVSRPTEIGLMHDTATGAGYNIAASKGITGRRKGYKSALFEGGIGVPFIARWPGKIAAGVTDDQSLISAVDLLPTFCKIAGAKLPEDYQPDGVSQVETLLGKPKASRDKPLYWKMRSAWPIQKTRPFHWVSYATVQDHWKLMSNEDGSYYELYDIAADPLEKRDLKDEDSKVAETLLASIDSWKKTLPERPSGNVFSRLRTAYPPSELGAIALSGPELYKHLKTHPSTSIRHLSKSINMRRNPSISLDSDFVTAVAGSSSQGRLKPGGIRAALYGYYKEGTVDLGIYGLEATSPAAADKREKEIRAIWAFNAKVDRVRIHRKGLILVVIWHDGVSDECWASVNESVVVGLAQIRSQLPADSGK